LESKRSRHAGNLAHPARPVKPKFVKVRTGLVYVCDRAPEKVGLLSNVFHAAKSGED